MPIILDREGFPLWGNPSPQKAVSINARQVSLLIRDAQVNQVFTGRADEISMIQKPRPKQARAEGLNPAPTETGEFGTGLIDRFMAPYTVARGKTP